MVCLGNICRSPMAQGAMEAAAGRYGLKLTVDSAGTSGFHRGESPDQRAILCMSGHGIDISAQRARQLQHNDFREFDIIFVMDRSNLRDVINMCPDDKQTAEKIIMLRGFSALEKDRIVPDPYYGKKHDFEKVYQLVTEAAEYHVQKWLSR